MQLEWKAELPDEDGLYFYTKSLAPGESVTVLGEIVEIEMDGRNLACDKKTGSPVAGGWWAGPFHHPCLPGGEPKLTKKEKRQELWTHWGFVFALIAFVGSLIGIIHCASKIH